MPFIRGGKIGGMDTAEVAVRSVTDVGPDSVAIAFETPPDFDASPGQFVEISVRIDDDLVQRFFTLSSPAVGDTFEVTVGVDPEGTLTPWLADREAGDIVGVSGPYGDVYYEGERRLVILAAGPGIGPAVGIGERAVENGASVGIIHPADNTVHVDRLRTLADKDVSILAADDGLDGPTATVMNEIGGTIFVYGFAPFVQDAIGAIEAAGYDPDEAKVESFGPGPD